ncbi:hypothetical protein BC941DRAFT_428023 [Chlamydoabsidia padenii]|nr:hypothetical protein BC941DRAFT_428023 [Chlamydoabsidia padenii]
MSQSPMSITQLCNTEQEEQQKLEYNRVDPHDPKVKLAAEALDSLASGKKPPIMLPPISTMSAPSTTPNTPSLVTPGGSITSARQSFSSDSTFEDDSKHNYASTVDSYNLTTSLATSTTTTTTTTTTAAAPQQHFIRRVSNHPFVHSALRAYESSKASSPVVKYGAEMVESFASPIYGKFGRQSTTETTISPNDELLHPNDDDATIAATTALANTFISDKQHQESTQRRGHKKKPSRSTSRSTSPHRPNTLSAKSPTVIHHHRHTSTAVSRSRWKQLMVHAGSAAGTTAAIISEESMKCLKYCLSWLQVQ